LEIASIDRIMSIKEHKVIGKKVDIERSISQKYNFKKVVTSANLKLFCKGLPEGATKGSWKSQVEEVEPLVSQYGAIQSIRIIERSGSPIAFVIFTDNQATERLLQDQPLTFIRNNRTYLV
jgi:hypothetical protein